MTKLHTILSVNTDPYISVRISMSYFFSTLKPSFRILQKSYVRLGRLVVSITPSPEVNALRMFRNTLIAVILCHEYIRTVPFVRSAYIRKNSLKGFIKIRKRRYMKLKTSDLLILCVKSVALSRLLMHGGRLSLPSFRSVEDTTFYLLPHLLTLIRSYPPVRSSMVKTKKYRS